MSKILEKVFPDLEKLNLFVDRNEVEFVSISTKETEEELTDFPFFDNWRSHKHKVTKYVLFYKEIDV